MGVALFRTDEYLNLLDDLFQLFIDLDNELRCLLQHELVLGAGSQRGHEGGRISLRRVVVLVTILFHIHDKLLKLFINLEAVIRVANLEGTNNCHQFIGLGNFLPGLAFKIILVTA